MRRLIFAAVLALEPLACGGAAEKKVAAAPPPAADKPAPSPLPHADRKDDPTVLVPGDPPLTQGMVDLYRTAMDAILDLQMTDNQREEFQKALIEDWKRNDPKQWAKGIESWRAPLSRGPYARRVWRAGQLPLLLDGLHKSNDGADAWLLAAYDAAHKPGSDRNPVLAEGDPPLTRDVVDQYGAMVEAVLDFSASGGLTDGQRRDLQDLLVKDWKGMDRAARQDFLQTLQKWPSPERFLVQLRAAPAGDQRSQYLLEIRNKEQEMAAEVRRLVQRSRETANDATRNAGPEEGHYEYNPGTGRYDRFVKDR